MAADASVPPELDTATPPAEFGLAVPEPGGPEDDVGPDCCCCIFVSMEPATHPLPVCSIPRRSPTVSEKFDFYLVFVIDFAGFILASFGSEKLCSHDATARRTHIREYTHTHGQKRPPGVESLVFLEGGTSSATNFDYGDESFSNRSAGLFCGQSNHQSPL